MTCLRGSSKGSPLARACSDKAATRPCPIASASRPGLTTSPTAYTFGSLVWPYSLTDNHRPLVRAMISGIQSLSGTSPIETITTSAGMDSPLSKTTFPLSKERTTRGQSTWVPSAIAPARSRLELAGSRISTAVVLVAPFCQAIVQTSIPTSPAPITTTALPCTSTAGFPLLQLVRYLKAEMAFLLPLKSGMRGSCAPIARTIPLKDL